jgi:hypothetical protein
MIFLEIYCNSTKHTNKIRQPKDLQDALDFIDRTLPSNEKIFFDIYLDKTNLNEFYWQKSFSLNGARRKQDAIEFVRDIWNLI